MDFSCFFDIIKKKWYNNKVSAMSSSMWRCIMEEKLKDLVSIAIHNLRTADVRSYHAVLRSARAILRHVQERTTGMHTEIQEAINNVYRAEAGYEVRHNVIKKLEELYEKL